MLRHFIPRKDLITTPVAVNGHTGSTKDLAVGQLVRAQARGTGDQLAVSRLQVRHLMVGPLQDIGTDRIKVMGQTVVLDDYARIPGSLGRGQKVAISGFVGPGGLLITTRLDAVSADTPDSVSGEISHDAQGHRTVGGVHVEGDGSEFKGGENARAEGRYDNGRLEADRVEHDDSPGRAERLVIQGPVKETGKDRLNVGGKLMSTDPAAPSKHELPRNGTWVRVEAQRRGKELVIEKIEVQGRILPSRSEANERSAKQRGGQPARESSPVYGQERERTERAESQEDQERPESPERHDGAEKPEAAAKLEAPERPEKIEAPEKVEAPERPEKIEAPEKVEAPSARHRARGSDVPCSARSAD